MGHSNRSPGKNSNKLKNSSGVRQNIKQLKNVDAGMKHCESNKNGQPLRQVFINSSSSGNNSSNNPEIVPLLLDHLNSNNNNIDILVATISMQRWRTNQQMMVR